MQLQIANWTTDDCLLLLYKVSYMVRSSCIVMLILLPICYRSALSADQHFDSNGVKIRYISEGTGEPVLLIHGFTVDLERQWVDPGLFSTLAKKYQTIAYDNRGHGKSDKPLDPKKYGHEMVEDAVRLLDHLKIKRAHVVGYSMGASIVNSLLIAHPDRVLSATLAGNAGKLEGTDLTFYDLLADDLAAGKGVGRLIVRLTPPGQSPPTENQLNAVNAAILAANDTKATPRRFPP
jgi:pimeloyl-ACP methyl ester carboxylesterase